MALLPYTISRSSGTILLRTNQDVVICRRAVAQIAEELKFPLIGKTMLVTAASELGRNTVVHGGGGELAWSVLGAGDQAGLRLVFEDQGPGIADLELAMTDGWSSRGGLGFGLSGAKRLVHEFAIESILGKGTRVVVIRWRAIAVTKQSRELSPRPKVDDGTLERAST
jgi:serine/threonine-protein kinase RsbT